MKKTFSIIAVALLLIVALTACDQTIEIENNEILVQYMSRIISEANYARGKCRDDTTSTELSNDFGFTTGTALWTTETSATVITFKDAKTTESNAVEAKITFNEDFSIGFEVEFTCDGIVYKAEGTAEYYELKDSFSPGTYWAEFTTLKIGKKNYKNAALLVLIDRMPG